MKPLPAYDYIPSGELALRITAEDFLGARQQWRDGQRQRLETMLNRFIVGLVVAAEAKKAERQRREELEKQWEQRRLEQAEQERLRWEEEKRIRLLKEDLAAWLRSREIRQYLAAVGADAGARCHLRLHDQPLAALDGTVAAQSVARRRSCMGLPAHSACGIRCPECTRRVGAPNRSGPSCPYAYPLLVIAAHGSWSRISECPTASQRSHPRLRASAVRRGVLLRPRRSCPPRRSSVCRRSCPKRPCSSPRSCDRR